MCITETEIWCSKCIQTGLYRLKGVFFLSKGLSDGQERSGKNPKSGSFLLGFLEDLWQSIFSTKKIKKKVFEEKKNNENNKNSI